MHEFIKTLGLMIVQNCQQIILQNNNNNNNNNNNRSLFICK